VRNRRGAAVCDHTAPAADVHTHTHRQGIRIVKRNTLREKEAGILEEVRNT